MIDRDIVIKELENYEPYARVFSNITITGSVVLDALALLKEREPKPVKVVKTESDYKLYYCPRCDRPFCDFYYVKPKFCDKCGQAVKWE